MAFPDKPAAHLLGSNGPVHAVAYSASPGTYILTGSADRSIRLYNPLAKTSTSGSGSGSGINNNSSSSSSAEVVPQGRLIQTFTGHGYEVLGLAVAADNERFASAGGDRAVFLWDVATATTTRRFGGPHGHGGRVNCVSFAGAGDGLVVSGGFDTTARIWDGRARSGRPVQVLAGARDAVAALAVRGPDVVTGSVDGRVRAYDVRMGRCATDVLPASVTSLGLTRDGRALLVGALDSTLRLMDRDSGACLRAYAHPAWRNDQLRVQSLLGGRETYVLVGDEMTGCADAPARAADGRVWAWDLVTGRLVAQLTVPWGPPGHEQRKKVVGQDGKEKTRSNVVSCMAWRDGGWGDQFCVGGTSGVVTVFGAL